MTARWKWSIAALSLCQAIKLGSWVAGTVCVVNSGILGFGVWPAVAIAVTVLLLAFTVIFLKDAHEDFDIPGALIVGGLISNLVDRVIHGGVVDYWWLGHRIVFNLADVLMVAGLVWVIVVIKRDGGKRKDGAEYSEELGV